MSALAVVGLGAMGSRMARRLLDAGHDVVVWNRTPAKATELEAAGATRAETPGDAAACSDAVITMVTDPEALSAVTEGSDGVAAGAHDGLTVLEMSTVGPAAVARLRDALPAKTALLDAPVLGSIGEAEAGTLRIFVGGDSEAVARCMPLLETLGSPLHVGPLGSGAAAKLVANLTLVGVLGVLGESLALADALALEREATWDVFAATPLAAQAERRRSAVESGEYPPRFALPLARKDADLIAAFAAEHGLDLRVTEAARSWLREAEAAGLGGSDYSAALRTIVEG